MNHKPGLDPIDHSVQFLFKIPFYTYLRYCHSLSAVSLISGGWKDGHGDLNSAEIFNPGTNTSCSLPPLPEGRYRHNQQACGGGRSDAPETLTCVKWSPASGTWNESHTLTQKRAGHVSWATSSGVYLIGGWYSLRTSEKVKLNGSVEEGFSLKYDTRFLHPSFHYQINYLVIYL